MDRVWDTVALGAPVLLVVGAAAAAAFIYVPDRGDDKVMERAVHLVSQPCADEGSPGPCFWNAHVRGNGQGTSFWVDNKGVVHLGLDDMPRSDFYVEGLDIMEGGR